MAENTEHRRGEAKCKCGKWTRREIILTVISSIFLATSLALLVVNVLKLTSGETTPGPSPRECFAFEERCADGSGCYSTHARCNGYKDCADGSDEDFASCGTPCDGQHLLEGPSGSFGTSETYELDSMCTWTIRVDQELAVQVDVQFGTTNYNTLRFYEGVGGNKHAKVFTTAMEGLHQTVWLLSDKSTVEFFPDFRNGMSGFRATYKTVKISSLTNEQKLKCNFERGMCLWTQAYEDDRDWSRLNRLLHSPSLTGPSADHTLGDSSGFFLRTPTVTQPANVISCQIHSLPLTRTTEPMCLNFWYSMNGADVYRLNVLLKETNSDTSKMVFQKEGNYGDKWNYGQVTLDLTTETTVVFEALINRGQYNQIALDDIALAAGACGSAP